MTATIHTPRYYVEKSSNITPDAPAAEYVVLFGSEEPWWDGKIYHVGSQEECAAEANRLNGSCTEIISQ